MQNKQLIIGVTMGLDDYGKIHEGINYSFIRRDYGAAIKEAGAEPIFFEAGIDPMVAASLCDGVIISGGEDIDPQLYGEETRSTHIKEPTTRTLWERELIDACDAYEVPILGICYGQQLLNVHYGGTLYQDIATERENHIDHGSSYAAAMHKVSFLSDGLGFKKDDEALSASRHHQAVKDLAPGFEAVATADDGVIEAIKGRGHFGIQWHPESDGTAAQIYSAFVGSCRQPEPVALTDFLPEPA